MSQRATIGVLITYFGERELLRECLESLAHQSTPVDEILVYDDASSAPPDAYVPDGLPSSIIRGDVNHGPAFGRNALLKASTSRYVHFHDADDLFSPDWCQRVGAAIASRAPDVVFTEIEAFEADTTVSSRVLGLERLERGDDLVRFCIQGAMLTPSGTYRRDAVLGIGGYRTDLVQSEDWDFHVRLAASGVRFAIVDEPLVRQRLRADGRHQRAVEVWTSCCAAIDRLADELPHAYRHDLANAAARAGSHLFALGARADARNAFELGRRLGPAHMEHRPRAFGLLARTVGFEAAEELAATYRKLVPSQLRAYVAGHVR